MAKLMSKLKNNTSSDSKPPKSPKPKGRRKLDIWNKLAIGVLTGFFGRMHICILYPC